MGHLREGLTAVLGVNFTSRATAVKKRSGCGPPDLTCLQDEGRLAVGNTTKPKAVRFENKQLF